MGQTDRKAVRDKLSPLFRNEAIMGQYTAGAEPPRKKKYKDTALRIQTIVNNFENCELLDYLRGFKKNDLLF